MALKLIAETVSKPIGTSSRFFAKVTYSTKEGNKAKETKDVLIGQGFVGVNGKKFIVICIEKNTNNEIYLWCTEVLLIVGLNNYLFP